MTDVDQDRFGSNCNGCKVEPPVEYETGSVIDASQHITTLADDQTNLLTGDGKRLEEKAQCTYSTCCHHYAQNFNLVGQSKLDAPSQRAGRNIDCLGTHPRTVKTMQDI